MTSHRLHSAEGCNPGALAVLLPELQSSSIFLLMEMLPHTDLQSLQLAAIKHDKVVNINTSVWEALVVCRCEALTAMSLTHTSVPEGMLVFE